MSEWATFDRIQTSLGGSRNEIELALEDARNELRQLDERKGLLSEMIRRAEAILGASESGSATLTLHEALDVVLTDAGNEWTHVRDLADAVNRRGLYARRDGGPVQPNQVHARTRNYMHLFEKRGPMVRLRLDPLPPPTPGSRSKYDALADYLRACGEDWVTLKLEDLHEIVGKLPPSAYRHPAWWANESKGSHVQARAWMSAGWRVDQLDLGDGWVRFRRHE